MNSWGGTTSRTWFYDFSAGPEWNTDELGRGRRRISTATATRNTGCRRSGSTRPTATGRPSQLGVDMGLLTRFVAINLLFTTSPLYDPLITAPDAARRAGSST